MAQSSLLALEDGVELYEKAGRADELVRPWDCARPRH